MNYTLKQIEKAVLETGDRFEKYYLDWVNNFLTYQGYADFYGISIIHASKRIELGRKIHKQKKG
jgi:hypothetical protein